MAKVINVYGNSVEVKPMNGTDFSLEELQTVVGGYIENLNLYNNEIMVLNEEGKLEGLAINEKATHYLFLNSDYRDVIVGDVLICDSSEVK